MEGEASAVPVSPEVSRTATSSDEDEPVSQPRSVNDMVRVINSVTGSNKRGRAESESPVQRDLKTRDTGDDWSKFETVLEAAVSKLRQQIQADFEEFQNVVKQQFSAMGQRLRQVEEKLEKKTKELDEATATIQETQHELKNLQAQVEENERVTRLPSLILSGAAVPKKPPQSQLPVTGENVEQLTVDLLRRHFPGLPVTTRDVDRAHRLPGRGDPRIICRFVQSGAGSIRDTVYQNRLDLKGRQLYISECLTKKRAEVLRILSEAKKAGKLYTAFSRQGHVYYKLEKAGANVRVDTVQEALEKFVA